MERENCAKGVQIEIASTMKLHSRVLLPIQRPGMAAKSANLMEAHRHVAQSSRNCGRHYVAINLRSVLISHHQFQHYQLVISHQIWGAH